MSATLIAVVLALLLGHAIPSLARLRRFGWFTRWLGWLGRQMGTAFASPFALLLALALPLGLTAWLQQVLDARLYGIAGFLFAVAVLVYCWGPRDLDQDVEAIDEAPDTEARQRALAHLAGNGRPLADDDACGWTLATFTGARRRWFGVLFWFLLLGPFGALLYRLAERANQGEAAVQLPPAQGAAWQHLLAILDWPVAHLMTLALAVAGHFDTVYGAWRVWHATHRHAGIDFSSGFIDAAAWASVQQAQRDAQAEMQIDPQDAVEAPADAPAASALHLAMAQIWRILVVWIVVLALFVLAGYV